jgi:hypothetical protein
MANSTVGSHGGSFAGGFAKAFLAVMQMAMRKRQLDDMHAFYGMMIKQMQANIAHQQGDDALRDRLTHGITPWKGSPLEDGGKEGSLSSTLAMIRKNESGGNYSLKPEDNKDYPKSHASGAYQYEPATWAQATKDSGIGTQYKEAYMAPPEVQDAVAAWSATHGDINSQELWGQSAPKGGYPKITNVDFTPEDILRGKGRTPATQASAIDNRESSQAKMFLASVSNHPDRPGDTSNMQPEFATRMAAAIKQANAEGIPARLESGYRDPDQLLRKGDRSQAAYFDASGQSHHTDGTASDVAGIGLPGSATARRWSEIANANGLSVPYGYDNQKEWNHTELAGETRLRGAQPPNAATTMVAGPGARTSSTITPSGGSGAYLVAAEEEREKRRDQEPSDTASNIPIGGGPGMEMDQKGYTGTPAPDQTITGRTPEMLTPTVGATDPRLQPAPAATAPAATAPAAAPAAIPSRGVLPAGLVQSNVGGVRGQQPGTGGPIYTAGQFGQPQPTQQPQNVPQRPTMPTGPSLPAATGTPAPAIPPPDPRTGLRPQQVPPSATPMPPKRPANLSGAETDTSGNIVPTAAPPASAGGSNVGMVGGLGDPLWAGYAGASPDQSASADPLNSLYSSTQASSAESGLTDTSGLMAAGMTAQMASMDDEDVTATMYKGGPVIRYRMGGVINRYAQGGDTDDMLAEYGGTDTDDPMANAYWDQMRVNQQLTNNSERAGPDLPTSIMNRAAQPTPQDQPGVQLPPAPDTTVGEQPAAPSAAPAAAPTDQPAAPPSEEPTPPQPTQTGASDIPPGSVQVAGPGGWGSVRSETTIPMPRVGSMGGGLRMPRPSMSTIMRGGGGGRVANVGRLGNQPLYVPDNIASDDFNHPGIAPTHNADGNPSVWLLNMVDNGVRALFTGFGFANQGAIPNSAEGTQNLNTFLDHPGMSKEDMDGLGDLVDPKHQLYEGGRDIAGAVGMIKYYAITGQLDAASRLSGGVLLYTRMMSMQYGDEAVKSLFNGDYKNAVKSLEKGYNWVPDAKTAEATEIDPKTGKVHAVQKDGNGKVIAEQDYLPAAIMKAALGLKDGTGFWNMLSSVARAGGNDPLGSHYETQRLLRTIGGNENVPLPPVAAQSAPKDDTLPITAPPPDQTAPPISADAPPAPDTTITSPDQTAPPPDQTQPPIPTRDANQNVGQAAPPPTAAPPAPVAAIPNRGDASNLVAGPGAPSTIAAAAPTQGGSGATLVEQQRQRELQAQQSKAVDRMIQGGAFDGDDPYVQQKIADIQKRNIAPLQAQRTQMEQQFADIEGADISPAEKRSLQVALAAKIKNFDETRMKPAVAAARQEYGQFASGLKQQFQAKMAIVKRQQKVEDIANTYDNQRVAAEQKRQAALDPNNPQMRAHEGIFPDGSPLEDKEGKRVLSYGEQLTRNLSDKDTTDTSVDANPISRFIRAGNPWLSSSYDGSDPTTVDMSKVPDSLFKPVDRKTMNQSARDMIMYNSGTLTYRDAQDFTTGVATGAYTIQRVAHPAIHSRVLGDIPNDDGIPRTDVLIGRGLNDPNPERVVMSTDNANRLVELAKKAETISIHNKTIADIKEGSRGPRSPSVAGPIVAPSSASKSTEQAPSISNTPLPPRQDKPFKLPPFVPSSQVPDEWKKQFPELNQ